MVGVMNLEDTNSGAAPAETWEGRLHSHLDRVREALRVDLELVSSQISQLSVRLDDHAKMLANHDKLTALLHERISGEDGLQTRLREAESGVKDLQRRHDAAKWWVMGAGAAAGLLWAALTHLGAGFLGWLRGTK